MIVRSITHAMSILRHLSGSPPLGVSAIARAVQLSPSTCFNILKTLVQEGLISFDGKTKKYALEPLPAQYFVGAPRLNEWFQWLNRRLARLASDYLMSCGLWEVRGDRLFLVEVIDSPGATRVHLVKNQRLPLYLGAIGRCVAVVEDKSKDAILRIIAKLRWQTAPAPDAYWESLALVRERGWAIDQDNFIRGLTTIAAPIRADEKTVRYCLTAVAFTGQHETPTLLGAGGALASIAIEAEQRWLQLTHNHDARG